MKTMNKFGFLIISVSIISTLLFIFIITNSNNNEKFYNKNNESIKNEKAITSIEDEIQIDIRGNVQQPGVYILNKENRFHDLINMAGGFQNANELCYNLAQKLNDGTQIIIKSSNEPCEASSLININTANEEDLTRIKGIGPGRANSIIEHRNKNGLFNSIEDIKNVTGIGDATFEKLKDQITI